MLIFLVLTSFRMWEKVIKGPVKIYQSKCNKDPRISVDLTKVRNLSKITHRNKRDLILLPQNQNGRSTTQSFLSVWAEKGPIQVYIAKYNYDPFAFSPNENPEAELPLVAGDYVLVVGEMDEVSSSLDLPAFYLSQYDYLIVSIII